MKLIYECEWCNFRGTEEIVRSHEKQCQYSPKALAIQEIRENCPYRVPYYEDFYKFYYCKKKRDRSGGYKDCDGGFECENFS